MIAKVGPIRLRHMLDALESPENILRSSVDRLTRLEGVSRVIAEGIADWENQIDLTAELKRIEAYGCHILTPEDPLYPVPLRNIYDAPFVLYLHGSIQERDHHGISMVGSRRTTSYGRELGRKLAYQMAQAGVTIVSGGARGIDTAAHQGALRAGGRTIAVLGSGLDIVYPAENRVLFDQVASQGAVITQFPFGRKADRQTFPIRNRIVAGMSLGTLVVEANCSSGALITANLAVDYGRQVFAVPGRVDASYSKGCHALIKNGAKLCETVEDILSEFEYLFPAPKTEDPKGSSLMPLGEEEALIWHLLEDGECHLDALIRGSGWPASRVSVLLMTMEMKRLVNRLPGQVFQRLGK